MALSRSVQQQQSTHYLENVKAVGFELRKLLEAVDQLVPALPISTHREVSSNSSNTFVVMVHEQWIKLSKKVKKRGRSFEDFLTFSLLMVTSRK